VQVIPHDPERGLASVKALIDAGADIEAVSAPDSGDVPSGTALEHG
jgi:hypothetical protein